MKFQAATWQELGTLKALAASGYHCLAVDMPGFGGSAACEAEQEEVLGKWMQMIGVDRPVLVGPSMGGRIALEFAISHPDSLGGLVLVGTVGVEENTTRLSRIDIPTLVVWGSNDQVSPLANSETLLAEIKGSKRYIIDDAPHPCYLDQPDRWHEIILEFLASG